MDKTLVSKFTAELLGTFAFLLVILQTTAVANSITPLAIGIALTSAIFMVGKISGGHFNPAVSVMMFFKNPATFPLSMLLLYVVAQLFGGLSALFVNNQF